MVRTEPVRSKYAYGLEHPQVYNIKIKSVTENINNAYKKINVYFNGYSNS